MVQSTLHKPKSKLRLRLGLTPPHPKPTATKPPPLPVADIPAPTRISSLNVSTHTDSLSSTETSTTTTSRPDSRSLFIYDNTTSPSTQGEQVIQTSNGLTFDTISYASNSPASGRFERAVISSPHRHVYPTPSTSGYESEMDPEVIDTSFLEGEGSGQDTKHRRTTVRPPDDVLQITDEQFYQRFELRKKVGHGNWGAVYQAQTRKTRWAYLNYASLSSTERDVMRLGTASAASGGGSGGRVALKMVPLKSGDPCDKARVKALWGEMKVVRLLRQEPHPSIIQFEAIVKSDTFAFIVMPFLSHLVQVCLDREKATPYFRQLASAVGYLHERGITHNDIKPANIMISHNNIPVLVDFGFAHYWPMDNRDAFWSEITWGTPEYLDPHRAQGLWHDERASDVWSLGITFFEILTGRTPFELDTDQAAQEDGDENYIDPALYAIYIERSLAGVWLGEWSIDADLIHLIENMLQVDPSKRITAMQAYHHPSLQPIAPSVLVTPQFIRDAVSFETTEPVPVIAPVQDKENDEKPRRKKKTTNKEGARSVTPALPLGESIKQHTSASRSKKGEKQTPSPVKKGSRLVIKKIRSDDHLGVKGGDEEDITPTKVVKPAQPLTMGETTNKGEKTLISRPSHRDLARPASRTLLNKRDSNISTGSGAGNASARSSIVTKENLAPTKAKSKAKTLSHRTSNLSTLSTTSTVPTDGAKDEDTARLKTMQSLEANSIRSISTTAGGKKRDVLAAISRPAPEPPRPVSMDSAQTTTVKEKEVRRSLGVERILDEVKEVQESPVAERTTAELASAIGTKKDEEPEAAYQTVPRHKQPAMAHVGSPPKKRLAKPAVPDPLLDPAEDRSPPRRLGFTSNAVASRSPGKEAMMTEDQDKLGRFRQISGDLVPAQITPSAASAAADEARGLQHRKSIEALALDNRLDKISEWVKTVESIVDQARKAIAEGRDIPATLLTLPMPTDMTLSAPLPAQTPLAAETEKEFGVTPEKSIPVHLRTSSTQVEPATPPKWMTYAEAEERIKNANAWMEDGKTSRPASALSMGEMKRILGRKERGSVANVLKIFGAEKEKEKEKSGVRSPAPQPDLHVPLKSPAPTLRATPSVPMLRSDSSLSGNAAAQSQRIPARKSESNLRAFNTLPTSSRVTFSELVQQSAFSDDEDDELEEYTTRLGGAESPRSPRRLYERFLDSTPGVVRQGDGWSSLSSGKGLAKPSSMASLRERARLLLHGDTFTAASANNGGRNIVDLSVNTDRRQSKQNLVSAGLTTRPTTPGAASVLTATSTTTITQKGWGIWKGFKGLGKKGKGMDKVDEA